jgi:TPP-dependent pyruvate/acetoin dehydrogenase alpha subunit
MKTMEKYTEDDLISFENEIADLFNDSRIKAPVHLYNGNEKKMIEIFENVKENDWIFCTWRSHYQCLLKGVPKEELKKDILEGKSITLCYPEHNIYSSAIVTGSIPISVGVALDIKRKGMDNHVWCFLGDMASETGTFYENWKYSVNHDLPITFVIEDNGKSVCTDTRKVWNTEKLFFEDETRKVIYYKYETIYPHAGAGKRIQF